MCFLYYIGKHFQNAGWILLLVTSYWAYRLTGTVRWGCLYLFAAAPTSKCLCFNHMKKQATVLSFPPASLLRNCTFYGTRSFLHAYLRLIDLCAFLIHCSQECRKQGSWLSSVFASSKLHHSTVWVQIYVLLKAEKNTGYAPVLAFNFGSCAYKHASYSRMQLTRPTLIPRHFVPTMDVTWSPRATTVSHLEH